jgi:hypothetical protein
MSQPSHRLRFFVSTLVTAIAIGAPSVRDVANAQDNSPPGTKPSTAECMIAAGKFSMSDEKTIAAVIACVGTKNAPRVLRLLATARGDQAPAGAARVVSLNSPQVQSNQVLGYLVNGRVVRPNDAAALSATGLNASAAAAIPLTIDTIGPIINANRVLAERQNATLDAFNTSMAGQTAGTNEAARLSSQLTAGHCAYKNNTLSATTGLVSLASTAAIYTRSQLGILSLLAPILFSKCDNVTPPSKPVVKASASSVDSKKPITLTVTESNYTGTFTVTASANDIVDISLVPDANPPQFAIKVHEGFVGQGVPVTLSVADDHGQSTVLAISVSGGT